MGWVEWHDKYADANANVAGRLAVVRKRVRQWLDESPPRPLLVVSICAGQGHDLIGALRDHPRRDEVSASLLELEADNVSLANASAREAGLRNVTASVADASVSDSYLGKVPADLVLCCGVLGHLSRDDIARLIGALPALCAPGGSVIWTRHRRAPDLTPEIRGWFAAADFAERSIDVSPDAPWVVGWHCMRRPTMALEPHTRLFTFGSGHVDGQLAGA